MIQLGQWTLGVAFGAAILTFVLGVVAFLKKDRAYLDSAVRGTVTTTFFVAIASAGIIYAFVAGDYGLEYVWAHSDRDMSLFYKIGAFWGGQEGSLLFWGLCLAIFNLAFVINNRRTRLELMAPAISTLMFIQIFFLGIVLVVASPFGRIPNFVPPDGRGLNPLLQHPAMVIHPPSLYLGFVGMAIPFALAIGALVSGRLDDEWIKRSRVWTLIAWMFLGAGNILGGMWAYVELGWGGYWAWDPVENAAFMPWLASTAFMHSVMMQERKGMLKVWNMVLIIVTFLLTIFGTFITRSGLISSVHSFAQSPVGAHFAAFLIVVTFASFALLIYRLPRLKSDNRLDAFVSRESFFILNNLVLLVAAFAVLLGTLFPMISEAVTGQRVSVIAPTFNKIMTPIGLLLLFLTGAGPLIPWRRSTLSSLLRVFRFPLLLAFLVAVVLLVFHRDVYALLAQLLCTFIGATVIQEFWRGARARRRTVGDSIPRAVLNLVVKNRRRYGGYIVHVGVALIFLGFSGNAFNRQGEGSLEPGQSMDLGPYSLTFLNIDQKEDASIEQFGVNLLLSQGDRELAVLFPQKNWYKKNEQLASEVAIYSTLKEDVYVVLAGFEGSKISLIAYLNPLVQFFWIGGIVMLLGGVIAALPGGRRKGRS